MPPRSTSPPPASSATRSPSDFWSLRTLVAATLTAAASGISNWSHDVGGYLGERLMARCPKELLLRWVQFGCFTPLMQAHARFQQEPWTYDAETLRVYREHVLLHERLVPYVRAAAATAARSGVPIIRPLLLTHPRDARGWAVAAPAGHGPPPRGCSPPRATPADGRSPTRTATARRSGSRRCWRPVRARSRWICRAATGS